jgi:predicted nucleic acid-binding protein
MMLVVDANIIMAALIKDGKSRELIISGSFTLVRPDYMSEELDKYKERIAEKAGLSIGEIELLIALLLKRIRSIPYSEYKVKLAEARNIMKNDVKDVPYVACYLALKCDGIWTNDTDYDNTPIKIFKTHDLLPLL